MTLPALPWMPRPSVALFLSTLALAGGTVACSHTPEAGEQGGEKERPAMTQPTTPGSPADQKGGEREEGGEGGEGGEG